MKTIPEEIMTNIFSRVPAKCIGRSRCVSKLWRHLLSELHFIKAHLDQTKQLMDNELLMFISDASDTLFSASVAYHTLGEITALATELSFTVSPEFYTEGMPSCDGLILIEGDTNKRLLVNPTTKQVRELPVSPYAIDPSISFTMYGLGYDHVNDDYKVVTLSYYNTENGYGPLVHSVTGDEYEPDSTDNENEPDLSVYEYDPDCTEMFVNVYSVRYGTWKQVESSPYDHVVAHLTAGVFVSGFIHWMASRTSEYSSVIVGYDLMEEKFHEVPAPPALDGENFVLNRLMVLGGCLSIPSSSEDGTDVWVMKEYGVKQSWTKFSIVESKKSDFRPLLFMSGQQEVVTVKNEETVDEKLVLYNLDTATFNDITTDGLADEFHVLGSFTETLISPYYNHDTRRI